MFVALGKTFAKAIHFETSSAQLFKSLFPLYIKYFPVHASSIKNHQLADMPQETPKELTREDVGIKI